MDIPSGGPIPTSFRFDSIPGYKLDGNTYEVTKPVEVMDDAFGFKIKTIERPKIRALKMALLLFSEPCEKKATVMGIIGNTHGVRTPANPARREIRKNFSNPLSDLTGDGLTPESALFLIDIVPVFSPILIENSTSFGGEQVELLHAM